ncbi:MAG: hypothetical protein ABI234_18110 [Ktedonobacteraceae bacterium]
MQPNEQFLKQPKHFWANVRTLSQLLGYTHRNTGQVKIPSLIEVIDGLERVGLSSKHIAFERDQPTPFGQVLCAYFTYRADVLNNFVEKKLMNVHQAKQLFTELHGQLNPGCKLPKNKQKNEKKDFAFFTCIINMLIEANIDEFPCNYDPRALTTVTLDGAPLRTLARRVDGAFPTTINPIAIWEIKEYYYTTTFGSRVADGVYETLLDGLELEELREHEGIDVKHYLMIDDYNTWWNDGRSYLCRIIDMLHMGYVDEVLFGVEVVERLPLLAKKWVEIAHQNPELVKPPLQ